MLAQLKLRLETQLQALRKENDELRKQQAFDGAIDFQALRAQMLAHTATAAEPSNVTAPGAILGGEDTIFDESFVSLRGGRVESGGWKWMESAEDSTRSVLSVRLGTHLLEKNLGILLREEPVGCCAIETTLSFNIKAGNGEEAALWWYMDKENYARIVIKPAKDCSDGNSARITMERKRGGGIDIVKEMDIEWSNIEETTLRLELSPDRY